MRKRIVLSRRFWTSWLLGLACLWAFDGALAQEPRADAKVVVDAPQYQAVLEQGRRLEDEGRWGDALQYYERTLRAYPDQAWLEERIATARMHLDIARRYSDSSFTNGLRRLNPRESLSLYNEILLKLQTHYVESPSWREIFLRGFDTWAAALEEPSFRVVNGLPNEGRFAQQIAELRSQAQRFRLEDRRDVYNAAAYCAQWAERTLNVPQSVALLEFAAGALGALDEYSSFLTGTQLDEVFSQIEGNFVGLGVELKARDQALLIVDVIPGGPAAEGGIQPGELIVAVDGVRTADYSPDHAADMLKGVEGSQVTVRVQAADGRQRDLRLTRRRVEVPSVDRVGIIDEEMRVGYMRLTSFQKTTSRDVDAALWQLHRMGMRALIVDVRGNPGGLLTAAVDVADKFLSQGAIVSTRGRSPSEDYDYRAHAVGTWQVPLVVLIDGDSASASEIFAGAIHDQRRGIIVGQRSFGKGSVQGIFPLQSAQAGVRLTTAKFYSPSGQAISKRGVSPDIVVQTVARPAGGQLVAPDDDPVLRAGVQAIRDQVSRR